MTPIRFAEDAETEFLAAIAYYDEVNVGLGDELLSELTDALALLGEKPLLGAPYELDTRRLVLNRFPYSIVYVFETDEVVVLAIAHHRRHPGYWFERR